MTQPAIAASRAPAPFIIAIDGPAAGGKGTLARKLSAHYHLPHLDTGLTYRFVAQQMLAHNLPLDNAAAAVKTAESLDFAAMDKQALADDVIGTAASKISLMPELRQIMAARQRRFAESGTGAVLDGRDIGTIVCPKAQVKLFIVADAATRARRRYREIVARGQKADYAAVLAALQARDARDSGRSTAPLKPAADAHLLDTTKLGIEEAFQAACRLVDAAKEA
ncbi:MAG: (d)CMP kinase [Candidatus Tokpelaia sp.]|nr:MAG: (d)CMP kinase [Candidatus Tokpelaia sp.]